LGLLLIILNASSTKTLSISLPFSTYAFRILPLVSTRNLTFAITLVEVFPKGILTQPQLTISPELMFFSTKFFHPFSPLGNFCRNYFS
jgi:hypothetical protein